MISYETYALVKGHINAKPLEPITLKGLNRPVVPYQIEEGLADRPGTQSRVIEENSDRIHLHIDLNNLDEDESDEIESTLEEVLRTLKRHRTQPGDT